MAGDLASLAANAQLRAEIQAYVDEVNGSLSKVEQVKRFAVLPGFWAAGSDELTPTMEVRGRVVAAKYSDVVESLYS
ncbi:hypothetical protein GCM10009547_43200 [Sporichthya brevicatena]|uniref:Uncharacterized protein n=1 Tax=Sporichthya brevicatena TaxID=171442 RepID=A0ABN1H9N6_9ACTN